MNTKIANAHHVSETAERKPLHLDLRSRATAALVAGCLALSLCPAVALAEPMGPSGSDAAPQGGNPPAEQQAFGAGGQAPSGDQQGRDVRQEPSNGQQQGGETQQAPVGGQQQASSGEREAGGQASAGGQLAQDAPQGGDAPQGASGQQAPDASRQPSAEGHQGAADDRGQGGAVDDQVRQILSDRYGVATTAPNGGQDGQQGIGGPDQGLGGAVEIPEIPEGEVNVQAVIDSVRDVLRQYDAATLESADFGDESFLDSLAEYVQTAVAQRAEAFANGEPSRKVATPADVPGAAEAADRLGAPDADDSAAPVAALEQLISFIVGLFS